MRTFKNVKEYRETTPLQEQEAFAIELQTWLGEYTEEVYRKVMAQMDEIISNEFALKLINELHERTLEEKRSEMKIIMFSLGHEEDYNNMSLHLHPLEHAKSYRDILYDMYIKR